MKINISFSKTVFILFLAFFLANCNDKKPVVKSEYPTTPAFLEYQNKRLQELQGNITNPGSIPDLPENEVLSLLMDWNLGEDRYATLSVLRDGRAKVFTSSGAKHIDIKHQNVYNEVRRFLDNAALLMHKSKRLKNSKLPEEGHFTFYFKTNTGARMAEGFVGDIKLAESTWGPLFEQANAVISEVRATYLDFGNNPEQ